MYKNMETDFFCCDRMRENVYVVDLNLIFDDGDPEDKPIVYIPKFDEYGIPLLDGSQSHITIRYCPWCGKQLPQSKRHLWFDIVEGMGLSPESDKIPLEFRSQMWWERLEASTSNDSPEKPHEEIMQ